MEAILKSLFENGDKIGVGVIAIACLVVIFFLVRSLFRYIEKDREKDMKLFEMQDKAIEATTSVRDASYSIRDASDRVADASEAQIKSSEVFSNSFPKLIESVVSAIDSGNIRLQDTLNQNAQLLSQKILDSESKMLAALQTPDSLSTRKGVIVIDAEGTIVSCNNDACILTGIKPDILLGSNVRDWAETAVYSDGSAMDYQDVPFSEAIVTARPFRNAVVGFQREDQTRWFLMDAEPVVHLSTKKVTRIIVSFRDIGTLLFLAKQRDEIENGVQSNTRVTKTIRRLTTGEDTASEGTI